MLAPVAVQVRVFASSNAAWLVQQLDCMKVPLASTTLWESPIVVQPAGGVTAVQVSATGS